mmetsp:Transcript_21588/g.35759  ORF Transcript_21588/g.35759 Transcript_21588/m.35759 type:complete len:331 (-) Transcript_21588:786-1778(-)|eukprot:CAMPEP_0184646460 /NCGR_PEP_ID=MMETSP0308-20130426/3158_1 /TAXON_ID=38269 /ORGANISM="Gloeochaete witrockiana, Strain SAG 46.84" /LENGTH=330 /DNA_ID=CAMNT_0027076483 /DNA_START=103 /DNA_END=1095 /DNA_ORIENTATION=-
MEVSADDQKNAVYLTNVSPSATDSTLVDFFSFCGAIKKLSLEKNGNSDTQDAVVIFEDAAASETALLLSNAVIIDRSVKIQSYAVAIAEKSAEKSPEQNQQTTEGEAAVESTTTALPEAEAAVNKGIFSSAFAIVAEARDKTVAQMKALDEKLSVSENLKKGTEVIKTNMIETGAKINTEFAAFGAVVGEGVKKVDEKLQIKAGLAVAKENIVKAGTNMKETAIKAGTNVKESAAKAAANVKETATTVKDQVSQSQLASKSTDSIKSLTTKMADSFSETKKSISANISSLKLGRTTSESSVEGPVSAAAAAFSSEGPRENAENRQEQPTS